MCGRFDRQSIFDQTETSVFIVAFVVTYVLCRLSTTVFVFAFFVAGGF